MIGIIGVLGMLFILFILCIILNSILSKFNIASMKIMLFGIGLIIFSYSFLKGVIIFGIDYIISLIGLSFCIVGFINKNNEN